MTEQSFDWDDYLETLSYSQVAEMSPLISSSRAPTMLSPDGKLIYLPTLDIAVGTSDAPMLESALKSVVSTHRTADFQSDRRRLTARIDCRELCRLLSVCSETPDKFLDPDLMLIENAE